MVAFTGFWSARKWMISPLPAVLAMLVVACAGVSRPAMFRPSAEIPVPELLPGPVCSYDGITFDGDIPSGRLNGCRQQAGNRFTLFIHPEAAPINPSAWYAFGIEAQAAQTLQITLVYDHGRHRYNPLLTLPGQRSRRQHLDFEGEGGRYATFTLDVPAGRSLISAQPLFTEESSAALLAKLSKRTGAVPEEIGQSEQGRAIRAIRFGLPAGETLVLLSGQHPAETKGAIALSAFADRLADDDTLASEFRSRFGVVVVPALNPDGIEAGHWRHNARGMDLNRDWGRFTQSETRALRDWLSEQGPLAALIDFHGTWWDVLYTQPDEMAVRRGDFAEVLRLGLDERLGKFAPGRSSAHNPSSPNAKTWFHETFAIPALTYEVGDSTPVDQIIGNSRAAAEIAMQYFSDNHTEEKP